MHEAFQERDGVHGAKPEALHRGESSGVEVGGMAK